ncbi:CaiB/BaiF CoA transferase family protein [Pontiella agarivorans]|uniref:CaiB/BaiF CoA transferase family protein n=1 Tax=Pontiella agarivorans TaxID=3038953 RepID=UPI003D66E834
MEERPLEGKVVLDFSQFLSGPSASLRLGDFGARVIKVEQPGGDICRKHYVTDVQLNGESTLFHAINRNKESICLDLKSDEGKAVAQQLIKNSDVMIHNFRPGVMEELGFGYETVASLNPEIIYGTISGYGTEGPWREKPGQDLLVQAVSGLTWLSGNADDGPVPMGLAVTDILAGAQLAQGILSKLVAGVGGRVAVSLYEAALDFQFEPLTVYFQDGGQAPERTKTHNAHAYLGAPYGIYQTAGGYLALSMGNLMRMGELIGCDALLNYPEPASWFTERDKLKAILAEHLMTQSTDEWLAVLEPADIWCAKVLDWNMLRASEAFQCLEMEQTVELSDGSTYRTTRCPVKLDGKRIFTSKGSPKLGEHTEAIIEEFTK